MSNSAGGDGPLAYDFALSLRQSLPKFMMEYRFAADEVLTKVSILREEFLYLHKYNPIEHVTSRVKSPESILRKVVKRGIDPALPSIRANITDIAGIRITCSFIKDTYKILNTLTSQNDLKVLQVKDYIKNPKANGYKSLHLILEIPVFLSEGPVPVIVEVQIRTIAQDFWASLEHKIFYKYEGSVPSHLVEELTDAANAAEKLDFQMQRLHTAVHGHDANAGDPETGEPFDEDLLEQVRKLALKSSKRNSTGNIDKP
ncbi:GTP pyrophosphokinase [Glutamicibacter sp. AOP38-B1-38]|uniref:GTP pyrophosphokinase n=1 Tax=Glutamicibacter sp. AOP38-B1-38 TaxID=3457680 RepID=UPI004034C60F